MAFVRLTFKAAKHCQLVTGRTAEWLSSQCLSDHFIAIVAMYFDDEGVERIDPRLIVGSKHIPFRPFDVDLEDRNASKARFRQK